MRSRQRGGERKTPKFTSQGRRQGTVWTGAKIDGKADWQEDWWQEDIPRNKVSAQFSCQ
jgi:hypothetical protein